MPDNILRRIGILGAGKVGTAIGRQALLAGFEVGIATAKPAATIELLVNIIVPGARAVSAEAMLAESDLVIIAIPLHRYTRLDPEALAGKVAIDVMNYWAPTEGTIAAFETGLSSSEVVQAALPRTHLVRTLNHIGYHEIEMDGRPAGDPDRRALAIAGNDPDARRLVAAFIDRLGYDPVDAGALIAARAFDIGTRIFSRSHSRAEMEVALADFVIERQEAE